MKIYISTFWEIHLEKCLFLFFLMRAVFMVLKEEKFIRSVAWRVSVDPRTGQKKGKSFRVSCVQPFKQKEEMKTSTVQWLHRQAYLLHDIGITRHFMFSKPPLRWNWAWLRAWGIWCVAPPNKSLLLLPDYPSAAMPVSSTSRSSQQPLCWKCMFSCVWRTEDAIFILRCERSPLFL